MNEAQQNMLKLLGSALRNEPFEMMPGVDRHAVYREMCVQKVAALPRKIIRDLPMDDELKSTWNQTAMLNVGYCLKLLHAELEIKKLFSAEQIPFTVLKGTASAMYYPQPLLRTRGDIDLITLTDDHERACECLEKNEYTRAEAGNQENARHIRFTKDGVTVELHRYFSSSLKSEKDYYLQALIEDGINHAGQSEHGVPVLPDTVNGLILLSHIAQHIDGGIGLRQWIDFVMFARAVLTDDLWHRSFRQETDRLGYTRLAEVLIRTGQIYLGLCKDLRFCEEVDPEVCEELLGFMLDVGDFGHKQEEQDFRYTMVLNKCSGSIKSRFRYLQRTGTNDLKAADAHPLLKPFAWLYKLARYGVKAIRGGRPVSRLLKGIRKSRKHQALFEKLGIGHR